MKFTYVALQTSRVLAIAAIAALAHASPAAAEGQSVPARSDAPAVQMDEVVVTAQKRTQTVFDVPQSISVVSGATLEQEQANSFSDYLKLVPGLQLSESTPGEGRLILRGINTDGVASTVGVYVDETPFGSSSGLVNGAILAGDFDTFDVARIEVLRGPQGTLYGASSMGGVIKFVTNAPSTDGFAARGRAGIESVDGGGASYSGSAMVNVPMTDTLAMRASGTYRHESGFINSIGTGGSDVASGINGVRDLGGRASLLFKPNERFNLRLSAVLQNLETDAPAVAESDPNSLRPLYGRLTQSQFVPQFANIDYRLFNATANGDLGFGMLTSATSYSTQNQTQRQDATTNLSGLIGSIFGVPNWLYLAQKTDSKKFTQELRLASETHGLFDWIVGGYYTNEDGVILQAFVPVVPHSLTPITTLPLLAAVNLSSKYEEVAGFANATVHFTDRFDLDVGGRYSHNNQHAIQVTDGALAGGPSTTPQAKSSEGVFTYSIAPKYKFSDLTVAYARVAKGFRPGGPNVLPPNPPPGTPTSYESDSLLSYEVGVKTETSDRRYGVDLAVYHLNWKRVQLLAVINGFGLNANGADAKSDGAEFTFTMRPVEGLALSLNGAYVDARLSGDTGPLVGGLSGDKLPFAPKFSGAVNGDYRWASGGMTPYVGASVRYLSSQSASFDGTYRTANGRQREISSYTVVDLHAGIDFGKFSFEAYAKNVGNTEGVVSTSSVTANGLPLYPNGAIGTGVIRPRTIGLSVTAAY